MADAILTFNSGSSSIKFSLFEVDAPDQLKLVAKGEAENLDSSPHFFVHDLAGGLLAERRWQRRQDFQCVLRSMIAWTESHLGGDRLIAVGHRIVHGGPEHDRPEIVTPDLLDELDRLTPLAPLHVPHNLAPVRVIAVEKPTLPQVVCFDTAFHHSMPSVATRFALPREYETAGVRRYGFHGLSYEYIAQRLREVAPDLANGRIIAGHLGNGASLCAMKQGRSIDTTMGFTALDGLVMGTRCGTIDPGVIIYLEEERGLSPKQVEDLLYRRSGLLGVSGLSSDMRTLVASREPRAKEAIDLFVYRIAREIGALTNSLSGLDGLVFTAGIGEHAPEIRALVCEQLNWLGVKLDPAANCRNAPFISAPSSRVAVWVIPTNEEAMIAKHTRDVVNALAPALKLKASC